MNIFRKYKNFFNYKGALSRVGFVLIGIGILLSVISFVKGIQILMFIPALVSSLFLYSYLEIRRIKKFVRAKLVKERGHYLIFLHSARKLNFFFRIGCKTGNDIILLAPNSNSMEFSFQEEEDMEVLFYLKGSFDILRYVMPVGRISNSKKIDKYQKNTHEDTGNKFIHIRKYENGDNTSRIDSIKSSFHNFPYIKVIENYESSKSKKSKKSILGKLFIQSDLLLYRKNDLERAELIHWLLIALNFFIIYIQWESLFLNGIMLGTIIIVLLIKKIFTASSYNKDRYKNTVILLLFFLMLFFTVQMHDMTGPGSMFLTQILIVKKLFPDEKEDGFLYIFLSMFVYVAVSLFSIALWFILFFLVYLFLAVLLLTTVSGYDIKEPLNASIGTKIPIRNYFRIIFGSFVFMVILFLVLPHGNTIDDNSAVSIKAEDNITGFGNEIDLKNASKIKKDTTKKIVVEDLSDDDKNNFKTYYWRGDRFTTFRNQRWQKPGFDKRDSYANYDSDMKNIKNYRITLYTFGKQNMFFPKNPAYFQKSDENDMVGFFVNKSDNSIYSTSVDFYKPLELSVYMGANEKGILQDKETSFNDFEISIDENTNKLFEKFWKGIDKRIRDNPILLSLYIKNTYGFTYTIDNPSINLEAFLYGDKRGYCEHYATVLAVTLQHFGYHATLVNGFYGGEWNNMVRSWIIRGQDAHSWVELYDKEKGWILLDATPNINDVSVFTVENMKKAFANFYDYLDLKWYKYIANYTGAVQKEILLSILNQKNNYLLFSLLALIIFGPYIYVRIRAYLAFLKLSPEDKFLVFLHQKSHNNFALESFYTGNTELVESTRRMLFGNMKPSMDEINALKKKWKELLNSTE